MFFYFIAEVTANYVIPVRRHPTITQAPATCLRILEGSTHPYTLGETVIFYILQKSLRR